MFWLLFATAKVMFYIMFTKEMGWAIFWAIIFKTHLVALHSMEQQSDYLPIGIAAQMTMNLFFSSSKKHFPLLHVRKLLSNQANYKACTISLQWISRPPGAGEGECVLRLEFTGL
jgi:hypothetical protein